jgi:molybdopterin molybdotransferase
MTGARVPEGSRTVVPVELTDASPTGPAPARISLSRTVERGRHIRFRGEDIRAGAVIAPAGTLVDAALLALSRSAGCVDVEVYARTRVAVIATGAELTGPGEAPGAGEIHESNSEMVAALAVEAGCVPLRVETVTDEPDVLQALLEELARDEEVDLVVTTGGVSQGAYEVVRQVGAAMGGFEFVHLAMQPGGPQGLGRVGATPVVCLPGTPVGAYVSFTMLLRPALAARHGHPPREARSASYTGPTRTTRVGKVQFLSALLGPDGTVAAAPGLHLRALATADALIEVPEPVGQLVAGDLVTVHPL